MEQEINELKDYGISFKYAFTSGLGCYEHSRYIKDVIQGITLTDEYGNDVDEIGTVHALIIHADEAAVSPFGLFEVLDAHSHYLANHIFKVYDTERDFFTEELENHYSDLMGVNVCFIKEVMIRSKYRGLQIGAKAIKDFVFHYASGCGLFALQPFPLQFEVDALTKRDKVFGLEKFEQNFAKAQKKLMAYYKSIGFENVRGIKDLMFYNPALQNKKFDEIDLEANPFG